MSWSTRGTLSRIEADLQYIRNLPHTTVAAIVILDAHINLIRNIKTVIPPNCVAIVGCSGHTTPGSITFSINFDTFPDAQLEVVPTDSEGGE